MVTATLSTRVDDWLWTVLRAGVPSVSNRVYPDDAAPANVAFPYVQYSLLSGLSRLTVNGTRFLGEFVYIVQAIGQTGNWDAVETPSDQIYTSLHNQSGAVTGLTVDRAFCEEEIRRAETTDAGQRYRYLGWRVRLYVEAA